MHAKLLSKLFNENFWSVIPIKIVFKPVCLEEEAYSFFPRETFKVCWIKFYLATATAFSDATISAVLHISHISWLSVAYTLVRITFCYRVFIARD